jgi:prepilin-type N-terminal cleavage/methylation domain-containing protein
MQLNNKKNNNSAGFTLVEAIVATAIFAMLAVGIYQSFVSLSGLAQAAKLKSTALALANEQLEIARNLSYADLGNIGGAPPGKIPEQKNEIRGGASFLVKTNVRSIDDPFDGTIGGTPNDLNPADYKLVTAEITCPSCRNYQPVVLTTKVAPKNLETNSGHGALFVQVIGYDGQAVPGVSVHLTNVNDPTLNINETTNINGLLPLVDLPPGNLAYKVEVNKVGYSSSRTYSPGETYLGSILTKPDKPHATVLAGQLTKLSLEINKLSSLQVKTIDQYCQVTGPFSFHLQGSRFMDADKLVYRYNQDQMVSTNGLLNLNNMEVDTYKFTLTDSSLAIVGSFPLQSIFLPPDLTSEVKLLLAPISGNGLLVSTKDGATNQPLSDVAVSLSKAGEGNLSLTTSRGFFRDTDWLNGSNSTDGNIEANDPAGEIKLKKTLGQYAYNGYLISRVFDTGTASTTFYNLVWQPVSQTSSTSVRFQLATNDDPATTTWHYVGPDGSSSSFYTVSGDNLYSGHNNKRYLRYKVYLATVDQFFTPNISDLTITYSSECLPFGQVFFSDLSTGVYDVIAARSGYQSYYGQANINSSWQTLEIVLNPNP